MKDEALTKAIAAFGGTTALAKAIGVQPPSIYSWEQIPPRHVPRISELTGIPRHQLRPDLWDERELGKKNTEGQSDTGDAAA